MCRPVRAQVVGGDLIHRKRGGPREQRRSPATRAGAEGEFVRLPAHEGRGFGKMIHRLKTGGKGEKDCEAFPYTG